MISQCCVCKKIEHVKCPKCGAIIPDSEPLDMTLLEKYENSHRLCFGCGHQFQAKDGGYSHGYCRPCMDEQLKKIGNRGISQVLANYNHGVFVEEHQ